MSRTRRRLLWCLAGLAILVAVLLIGPGAVSGPPLDPRSTAASGTRGILDVLRELGVAVEVGTGVPDDGDGVALVISDRMTDGQRDGVLAWARSGGRLVVADPLSALAPALGGLTSIAFTEPTIEPGCDAPVVAGVERVAVQDGVVYALPDGASGCFPRNGGFWMVRQRLGRGEQISLGGAFTLVNELLDSHDTGVLLVNLLTPQEGAVRVVQGADPSAGEEGLADVLPEQVTAALLQIPVVWLAVVWWRARRHGRPVGEQPPVPLDASDTTTAVGNLLHRAGRAPEAAEVLRRQVEADIRRHLGLGASVAGEALLQTVSERTDADAELVRQVLHAPLPADDTGFTVFASRAAWLRRHLTPVDASTSHHRSSDQ